MSEEIKRMRSEGEMYDLILNFARAEKRVRGVILNGRAPILTRLRINIRILI